jgi:hypothetical protein
LLEGRVSGGRKRPHPTVEALDIEAEVRFDERSGHLRNLVR